MPNPVCHFEISGKDYKKTIGFYKDLFDWEISEHAGMPYGMVAAGAEKDAIGGGISPVQEGTPPSLTFYVMVDDLQAYLDKAGKLGGKTVVPPTPIPGIGSFAMFADLDGNVVGLYKGKE
ncbi:MAG: VOC family protein [bacterium]|nr:VOC family protein [bacterium]